MLISGWPVPQKSTIIHIKLEADGNPTLGRSPAVLKAEEEEVCAEEEGIPLQEKTL